VVTW